MPFHADIVVTEPESSRVLLIVEVKTNESHGRSEAQLKKYMWEMSCPVGLFASPRTIVLYRNSFTGYSNDSIQKLGEFPAPRNWSAFEGYRSGEFETYVQTWLEKLSKNGNAAEIPKEHKEASSEN